MPSRRLLLIFPVMLALAASACGSSSNNTAAGAGGSPSTTAAPPASPATTSTTAAGSAPATVSTGSTALGMVLVNSAGRTLYHLDKDTSTSFGCTGSCLTAWPPLTVSSGSPVAGSGVTGTLATRARPDGTQQVTWNGMPLYTFAADSAPGDAKGDGIGGVWHAAKLGAGGSGTGSGSGPTTTSGSGGYNYP